MSVNSFSSWNVAQRSALNLHLVTSGLHASFDKGLWALVPMDHQYLNKLDEFFDKGGKWQKKPRDNDRMKVCVISHGLRFWGIDIASSRTFIMAPGISGTPSLPFPTMMA